jgi:uncharacterized protein
MADAEATRPVHPVFRPGGISYIHVPARDRRRAAAFYHAVFGWALPGGPDEPRFEDGTGHVIGRFVEDRAPWPGAGVLLYVYVEDVDRTLARAVGLGGAVVTPPYPEGGLRVAVLRDPEGNEVGAWQRTSGS